MKKAITAILTGIFALGIAFGASGCKQPEKPSVDKPSVSEPPTGGIPSVADPKRPTFLCSWDKEGTFTYFYENYIDKSDKERFYLLNIDKENTSYGHPTFVTIYGDEVLNQDSDKFNIAAEQMSNIYVDEFGSGNITDKDTGIYAYSFSLYLKFKLLPEEYIKGNDFKLEFTEYTESVNLDYKIKIFEKDILLAEGTYEQTVKIPLSWVENYLKQNLI